LIDTDSLRAAIEPQHGGTATLTQSVPVKETYAGAVVWEGVVHVFDLPATLRPLVLTHGRPDRRKQQAAVLFGAASGGDQIAARRGAGGDSGGKQSQQMTPATIFAALSVISGLVAAWYWYQASQVRIRLPDTPKSEDLDYEILKAIAIWIAKTRIEMATGNRLNKTAALWTAASVLLSAIGAALDRLSSN